MTYTCLVCGYPDLKEQPRGESTGGSYEICPSCGFQFAVSDDDRGFTYEQWRQKWIDGGMVWDKGRTKPPANWNPREQLRRVAPITGGPRLLHYRKRAGLRPCRFRSDQRNLYLC